MMRKNGVGGIAPAGMIGAIVLGLAVWPGNQGLAAQALSGTVTSAREGNMEGVLVSARGVNATFTTTVVTDASGAYRFPSDRLQPGSYTISVRAVGYVLNPSSPTTVQVAANRTAVENLRLEEASLLDKALQLSSAEWLMSYPLPLESKFELLRDCTRCHHQKKVALSRFNEEELSHVLQRMSMYWIGSTPESYQIPERIIPTLGREGGPQVREASSYERLQAQAVAAINLSEGTWKYPFKTYPRPTGADTRVIYTTYDLARLSTRPHDVRMGRDGMVYYDDFNDHVIGRVNPRTGEAVEFRFEDPAQKFPEQLAEEPLANYGNRVLKIDSEGKFYLTPPGVRPGKGYVVRFDPARETFEYFPAGGSFSAPESMHVDGRLWINGGGGGLRRARIVDFGQWIQEEPVDGSYPAYDMYVDSENNAYGSSRGQLEFWRVDAETLEATRYPIPSSPRGYPGLGNGSRRGMFDQQDRLWFGGFDGDYIGRLDPSLPADRAITLFPVPLPWFQPYMAEGDDAGFAWAGSISSDHVGRMNEATGEWNLYQLPETANIRQIHVARGEGGQLSSLWIGLNHQGKMMHIEPLP